MPKYKAAQKSAAQVRNPLFNRLGLPGRAELIRSRARRPICSGDFLQVKRSPNNLPNHHRDDHDDHLLEDLVGGARNADPA